MLVPACLSFEMVEHVPAGPEPLHHPGVFGRKVKYFGSPLQSMQGNSFRPSKGLVSAHHPGKMPSSGGPAATNSGLNSK